MCLFGLENKNVTFKPPYSQKRYFWAQFWRYFKENFWPQTALQWDAPLIVVVASQKLYSDRQIVVADYKCVVLDDPLPPSHVTWRMRIANFAIKKAHSHSFHWLLSNGSR